MKNQIAYSVAFITGIIIAFMIVCNTELGVVTSLGTSMLVNQCIGITLIWSVMGITRRNTSINPPRQKAPWYLWFGGIFALPNLMSNYFCIINIGATLTTATLVFGQTLTSVVFDLTGWLGQEKRTFNRGKILTLGICAIGIIIMATGGEQFSLPYILLGIFAGVLTMTQMVYNSRFSTYKGALFSARHNVFSGLAFIAIAFAIIAPGQTWEGIKNLRNAPWWLILGGGALGSVMVVSTNLVVSKIPTVYSALLMSSAQILTSVVIDIILFDSFTPELFIGTLCLLVGMAGNMLLDRKKPSS